MTPKQYKSVIDSTLTHLPQEADSLTVVREILRSCGIPLPNGSAEQILDTLLSDDYIGWDECAYRDAADGANAGMAAIGVNRDEIVLIKPQADKPAVSDAIRVSVPTCKRNNMHFYIYNAKTAAKRPWSYFAKKVIHAAEKIHRNVVRTDRSYKFEYKIPRKCVVR